MRSDRSYITRKPFMQGEEQSRGRVQYITSKNYDAFLLRSDIHMASLRFYTRRLRLALSAKSIQLLFICILIVSLGRYVVLHNHDPDPFPPMPGPVLKVDDEGIDWFKFAYVQYVTTPEYLCSALQLWSQVETIGSHAQRLMLYPAHWSADEVDDSIPSKPLTPIARLLKQAQTDYYVKLQPVDVLHKDHSEHAMWQDSYTKLLAFNLTQYDRVLHLESDGLYIHNMDEVFLLPSAPIAMPYTYFGPPTGWAYSSQLLLLHPSSNLFQQVESAVQHAEPHESDMDILLTLFPTSILAMPQRPYNLLSGEFRRKSHIEYLRNTTETWDPEKVLGEASYMHFSDWPIPKPWIRATKEELNRYMPSCGRSEWFGATDCRDRTVWLGLYGMYARRRKEVCGLGFEVQERGFTEKGEDRGMVGDMVG
ncbi:glucose N-acetyltransferase 1 protein [Rutstroemia sp. NJR-2017a WRK4]|nr:glucose N-acetyltransferase 1 protein [Rutstroemia sp. NJR-2017a WRK4]